MKIGRLVVRVVVIAFAALILADGVLSTLDPNSQLFSLNAAKGIVGFILIVLAASYFKEANE